MALRTTWRTFFVLLALLALTTGKAAAERIRFHYVPVNGGPCQLQPLANGAMGERVCRFGRAGEPCTGPPRPTCTVTLHHPNTGQTVVVPLALPWGTPRIEHVWDRIVYNYGSYTVAVQFLPDGSVDVIYNSGLGHGLTFVPDGAARIYYNGPPCRER